MITSADAADVTRLSVAERVARGKAARSEVPRSSFGEWSPPTDRPDPVALLEVQGTTRVPELVPIRYGRMAVTPFTFYRGAAAVMATDLASVPNSGLHVQLCGDAHLANFGGFASPDRDLVFDVNDFDETHPGPFEWDLERLAASIEIAARGREFPKRTRIAAVSTMAATYRTAMTEFAAMSNLDVWYQRLDTKRIATMFGRQAGAEAMANLRRAVTKAQGKDRLKAMAKLTHRVDGQLRFVNEPPLIVPIDDLFSGVEGTELEKLILSVLSTYGATLSYSRRRLLETYRYVHLARKVVGVGSVGTRAWVVLLLGRDDSDPLFLQVKEAESSVLEPFVGKSAFANHGERVVAGQGLMQAASDIFLGWERTTGLDGIDRDFYVRQLWDWKASANLDTMTPEVLVIYSALCGWTLARGHARSGDRIAIASYLGSGKRFDLSMARFAAAYADQNERDHTRLTASISSGRVAAESGI